MAKATSPKLTSITYNGVDISKYVTSENITAALHALESIDEVTLTDLPLKFVDDIEVVEDYVVVYNSPYPADLAATYRAALHEALANHAPLPRCRCAMIDEGESNG